jgi:hypothetical protein
MAVWETARGVRPSVRLWGRDGVHVLTTRCVVVVARQVNTIGPRACYDEGKRVAETMMYAYKAQGAPRGVAWRGVGVELCVSRALLC